MKISEIMQLIVDFPIESQLNFLKLYKVVLDNEINQKIADHIDVDKEINKIKETVNRPMIKASDRLLDGERKKKIHRLLINTMYGLKDVQKKWFLSNIENVREVCNGYEDRLINETIKENFSNGYLSGKIV